NRIYPVDFDVSPFHLIFILITLTLILKSIYLYKEWKGTCEEGMKEEAKDLEEKISENEIAQYEKILRAAMQEKLLFVLGNLIFRYLFFQIFSFLLHA